MNGLMYYSFALISLMFWLADFLTSRTFLGFMEILIMVIIINTVYKIISGKISNRKKGELIRIKYRRSDSI